MTCFVQVVNLKLFCHCYKSNQNKHNFMFATCTKHVNWQIIFKFWLNWKSYGSVLYSFSCTPSSIYSWSIDHILEHEFFCLGCLGSQGSKEKKSVFEVFWATFEGGFFNYLWAKKNFAHQKLKKPPTKVAQNSSNLLFFPYCPNCPNGPNRRIHVPKCGLLTNCI